MLYFYYNLPGHTMSRESTCYGEKKVPKRFTITPTALLWLEQKRIELNATSVSDVIERLARNII